MKRTYTILCLLLAFVLLFGVACTPKAPSSNGEDTTNNSDDQQTTVTTVDHIWYSKTNGTVVDLRNMPNITLYTLQLGFYQYTEKLTGTCTFEENVVTFHPEGGETYTWVFDTKKGALTFSDNGVTASYTTTNTLPSEYVKLAFPKYAELDCTALVTLPDYRNFEFTVNAELLAAVDLFTEYHETLANTTKREITGRAAQTGDYVCIDYKGFLDGVAFEGGEAENVDLLIDENNGYIPGFAEGIVGQTVGSTFDVKVTFPKNYHSTDLAGKETVFTMTLHAIYDLTLTDEEVKKLDEDAQDVTYAGLLAEYADFYYESDIQNQLMEKAVFADLPESVYRYFYQDYEESYRMYAAYYGMEYEALLQYFGLTDNDLLEEAKNVAKEFVLVYAIAQTEGLELTDADFQSKLDAYFDDMIENGDMTEADRDEALQGDGKVTLHVDFTMERVYSWVMDQVK